MRGTGDGGEVIDVSRMLLLTLWVLLITEESDEDELCVLESCEWLEMRRGEAVRCCRPMTRARARCRRVGELRGPRQGQDRAEAAVEIARAASAGLPARPDDLAPAVRDALDGPARGRFSVIIDALDEAASPAQARAIISSVVLPLAETCSDAGVQIIVGPGAATTAATSWTASAPPSTRSTWKPGVLRAGRPGRLRPRFPPAHR